MVRRQHHGEVKCHLRFGGSSAKVVVLDLIQREEAKKKRSGQVVTVCRAWDLLRVTVQLTHTGSRQVNTQWGQGWENQGAQAPMHTCMLTHTHADTQTHEFTYRCTCAHTSTLAHIPGSSNCQQRGLLAAYAGDGKHKPLPLP